MSQDLFDNLIELRELGEMVGVAEQRKNWSAGKISRIQRQEIFTDLLNVGQSLHKRP